MGDTTSGDIPHFAVINCQTVLSASLCNKWCGERALGGMKIGITFTAQAQEIVVLRNDLAAGTGEVQGKRWPDSALNCRQASVHRERVMKNLY